MTKPPTRIPESILDRKMVKRGRAAATKVMVQWKDTPPEMATWEYYHDLLQRFLLFTLEVKGVLEEE
ncbi:hypothetical protein A2U01_0092010, partial [Trifolium medium]|nr:hypothetical protein [Trifolium medium]